MFSCTSNRSPLTLLCISQVQEQGRISAAKGSVGFPTLLKGKQAIPYLLPDLDMKLLCGGFFWGGVVGEARCRMECSP